MKKLLIPAIVLLLLVAASYYWLAGRVTMTVDHPETPAAEAPKEDPPLIQALRVSIKSPESDAAIAELLKNGANPNATDAKGRSALYWALAVGDQHAIEALLAAGAEINKVDGDAAWTPLMHAVYFAARDAKNLAAVELLLNKGADVNLAPKGFSVLLIAVTNADEKETGPALLKLLLNRGANPNAEFSSAPGVPATTPLMEAAHLGKISLSKILVQAGAKLDTKGPGGKNASEIASENKHPELAEALKVAVVLETPDENRQAKSVDGPADAYTMGPMEKDVATEYLRRHQPQFNACFERQQNASRKKLSGRIMVRFLVSAEGNVTETKKVSSSLNNEKVETCVLSVIKRIIFPAANQGTEVNYPLTFPAPKLKN